MQLDNWLETAFGSPTRVRVLRYLAAQEGRERTLREVARALGVNPSTARVALFALLDLGLVDVRRLGRSDGYSLRPATSSNLVRRLFGTEAELRKKVFEVLRASTIRGASVVVFGSAVRKEQGPDSDLDILVVAATKDKALGVSLDLDIAINRVGPVAPSFISLGARELRAKWTLPWIENVRREGILVAGRPLESWT
ncbi:MAG: ArsR family transcriptional regulator [Euryarchaeota archaeon]|nr:ArsR family transcriptional regulator [Euryarchaeota archaeon]